MSIADRDRGIDRSARLDVEASMSYADIIIIAEIGRSEKHRMPVHVPLNVTPGSAGFLELTDDQAIDLYQKLGRVLREKGKLE